MARRSKEELLVEFDRLWNIFELYFEFELSRMSKTEAARQRKLGADA